MHSIHRWSNASRIFGLGLDIWNQIWINFYKKRVHSQFNMNATRQYSNVSVCRLRYEESGLVFDAKHQFKRFAAIPPICLNFSECGTNFLPVFAKPIRIMFWRCLASWAKFEDERWQLRVVQTPCVIPDESFFVFPQGGPAATNPSGFGTRHTSPLNVRL